MPNKPGAGQATEPRAYLSLGVLYFESENLKAGGKIVQRAAIVTEVYDQSSLMLHVFRPKGDDINIRSTFSTTPANGCWSFVPTGEMGG